MLCHRMIRNVQHIRNDDGVLAVGDENKKIAWKNYLEKLLNTEFSWDWKFVSGR